MLGTVAIVGGSLGGLTAAETLRSEGFGGRIIVIEAESVTPYDRPPLSKQVLAGDWEPDRIVLPAARPERLAELDLEWKTGHAVGLDLADRMVGLGDGQRVGFDGLILATGATPRVLPGMGDLSGVHVLRTLQDCLVLRAELDASPSRVVVIGAGFIGSEVAATCRARGLSVTLVEALATPLERVLGSALGTVLADLHRDHGVDLRLGVGFAGFETSGEGGDQRVTGVRLSDGSLVPCDVVVVGIGVTPNTGWLAGSGLDLNDGVVVDDRLRAAPGVVAVGDLARWPSARFGGSMRVEHWENAIQSAEHAARTLMVAPESGAGGEAYDPVPWFWSDQYDRKIQLAGTCRPDDAIEIVEGSLDERRFVALFGREDRVVGVLGMNRPRHVMQLRVLVEEGEAWDAGLARARALVS
ncbi:MAG: NAD(P)/FAD-dependent oxidoreductase [Acidimicrobiales bacterium]|nr:NAD(P)/FAD-dependent oxidoreductase [Acidimicrobiales bacterium]